MSIADKAATPSPLGVAFWRVVLALLISAAIAWWWFMPGGFPPGHPRFWSNLVLPWTVAAAAVFGIGAARLGRWGALRSTTLTLTVFWTAAAASATLVFPASAWRPLVPGLAAVAGMWAAQYLTFRRLARRRWLAACAVLVGITGALAPWTQRGPAPTTRPANAAWPGDALSEAAADVPPVIDLSDTLSVSTADGTVRVDGPLQVDIAPLLSFESRSPDRCWTILTPDLVGSTPRRRTGFYRRPGEVSLAYDDDALHQLLVHGAASGGPVTLAAWTHLDQPVWSHLNTFTEVSVRGHERLFLSFSPCPEGRVEVLPADYPRGRPARLVCLLADGSFQIVEATSGEKGPFTVLASGSLAAGAPLAITLYDDQRPACRLELLDWASQASRDLSPTAGWGLPQNAIEFSRASDAPHSAATIWIALAATSVGRGWDSVGHAAGVYRNRIRVVPIDESDAAEYSPE
jgi:hypothetical protein